MIDEIIKIGDEYFSLVKCGDITPLAHRASAHWFYWFKQSKSKEDLFAAYITDNQPQEHGPISAKLDWSWDTWLQKWQKKLNRVANI